MRVVRTFLAFIAVGASVAPVLAQSSAPAPAPPAPADVAIHGYGDRDKACLTWTDQCRSCTRAENDEVHCSNIGIACQPAEIACTARKPEPAK